MEARKQWLFIFFTMLLFGFINTVNAASIQQWPKAMIAITLAATWIYHGFLFYFAYRKGGTKLLTFSVVGGGMAFFSQILLIGFSVFNGPLSPPLQAAADAILQQPVWNLIGFSLTALYLYASIRLRSFNRRALQS